MKYLFSNGCSFLSVRNQCNTHVGLELANLYDLEPISLGSSGRGNDRIVTTTKLFFYHNPERFRDTLVLIGWSNPLRHDYINNSCKGKGYMRWGGWKKHYRDSIRWSTVKIGRKNTEKDNSLSENKKLKHLKEILELQDFFKLHGVEYCMYHALRPRAHDEDYVKTSYFDLLYKNVDANRFYGLYEYSHIDYITEKDLKMSKEDHHPNAAGHRGWAEKIKEFMDYKCMLY